MSSSRPSSASADARAWNRTRALDSARVHTVSGQPASRDEVAVGFARSPSGITAARAVRTDGAGSRSDRVPRSARAATSRRRPGPARTPSCSRTSPGCEASAAAPSPSGGDRRTGGAAAPSRARRSSRRGSDDDGRRHRARLEGLCRRPYRLRVSGRYPEHQLLATCNAISFHMEGWHESGEVEGGHLTDDKASTCKVAVARLR